MFAGFSLLCLEPRYSKRDPPPPSPRIRQDDNRFVPGSIFYRSDLAHVTADGLVKDVLYYFGSTVPVEHNPACCFRCRPGKQRRGEDRHQGLRDQAYIPPRVQGTVRLLYLIATKTSSR